MCSSDFLHRLLMRLIRPASSSKLRLSVISRRRSAKTELSSTALLAGAGADVSLLWCLLLLPALRSSSILPWSCILLHT